MDTKFKQYLLHTGITIVKRGINSFYYGHYHLPGSQFQGCHKEIEFYCSTLGSCFFS